MGPLTMQGRLRGILDEMMDEFNNLEVRGIWMYFPTYVGTHLVHQLL
jgi:hypothetical protein